jgi:hypothetical protein
MLRGLIILRGVIVDILSIFVDPYVNVWSCSLFLLCMAWLLSFASSLCHCMEQFHVMTQGRRTCISLKVRKKDRYCSWRHLYIGGNFLASVV